MSYNILYIIVGNGHVKFKFNNKPLHKNDFDWKQFVNLSILLSIFIITF